MNILLNIDISLSKAIAAGEQLSNYQVSLQEITVNGDKQLVALPQSQETEEGSNQQNINSPLVQEPVKAILQQTDNPDDLNETQGDIDKINSTSVLIVESTPALLAGIVNGDTGVHDAGKLEAGVPLQETQRDVESADSPVPLQETGHNVSAQKSVLDVEVSFFENYECIKPREIKLLTFLTKKAYMKEITLIRNEPNKKIRDKLKARIGAITPSGIFSVRDAGALIKHTGLIQFDIDWRENMHIGNYEKLHEHICNLANVAYCGRSASFTGFWGIVPIAYTDKHKQHFIALQNVFLRLGIVIDATCKDVCRLRGYSYNEDAYFNHQAPKFYLFEEYKSSERPPTSGDNENKSKNAAEKVVRAIAYIEANRLDITEGYKNWFALGASLAKEFGEKGRSYFHQISAYNSSYDPQETNLQYSNCLDNSYSYTLGTFIYCCRKYNVPI